jgi:putative transposase
LYWRYHTANIASVQVCSFLSYLLRHIAGEIILVWDENPTHKSGITKKFIARHPRLHTEFFPGYAPELNPDEYVWTNLKRDMANTAPDDLSEMAHLLTDSLFRLRRSQKLLSSCIRASTLSWKDIMPSHYLCVA